MLAKKFFLEQIGLSKREITIYENLLQTGPSLISQIARSTGINRPLIYTSIASLEEKGLVSISPKGKYKTYKAENPNRLRRIFEELQGDLNKEISELEHLYEIGDKKMSISYVEGKEAIKKSFHDTISNLKKGSRYYRYSSLKADTVHMNYLPKNIREIRDKRNLDRWIITNEHMKNRKSKRLGREIKVVPKDFDLFNQNINLGIYNDEVIIVDFDNEVAITIKNNKFAEFQKKIFELLFSKL